MWTYIFFIIFVIIIILLALLISKPTTTQPDPIDYSIQSPWSDFIEIEGVDGTCHTYTFVGEDLTLPIIRPDHISTCNNEESCFDEICICQTLNCYSDNQLYVRKMRHTCQSTTCIRQNGSIAVEGEIEEIFIQCSNEITPIVDVCPGKLSYISFNLSNSLSLDVNTSTCLNNDFTSVQCNLNNLNSLFLIERANLVSGLMTPSNQGNFARIRDRESGMYLIPVFQGNEFQSLTLTSSLGAYQGYYWLLLDSMEYYTLIDSVIVQTQQAILNKETSVEYAIGTVYFDYSNINQTVITLPNSVIYLNADGTYYIEGTITPPQINYDYLMVSPAQIVYVSDPSTTPGVASTNEIWKYVQDKYSLNSSNGNITMSLFRYENINSNNVSQNTNIINYLQFPQSSVSLSNFY